MIRKTQAPPGLTRRYYYNETGNRLAASEDELGRRTAFEYDDQRNLTRRTDPLGHATLFSF